MDADVRFVLRGRNRTAFVKSLAEGPKVLPEIRKVTAIHKSHITRIVRPLEERGIIRCHNPKDDVLRVYELTAKGKNVLEQVRKLTFSETRS